jgi:transcription-repair coupling factor (superfamily II helicase)
VKLLEKILSNALLARAAGRLSPGEEVNFAGVWGSSGPLLSAAMGRLRKSPILYIAPHLDDADDVSDDIEILTGTPAQQLPAWEVDIGAERLNDEVAAERLRLCNLLSRPAEQREQNADFIVAPVMALLQPAPTRETLSTARLILRRGTKQDPEEIAAWLADAGFESVDQVDQQGEFARRGGILDVFAPGASDAIRVEFFGSEIESIRRFDLDSQRSSDAVESYDVTAVATAAGLDASARTPFLSYLPDNTLVCVPEPAEVEELAKDLYRRVLEGASTIQLYEPQDILGGLSRFARMNLYAFGPRGQKNVFDMGIRSLQRLSINTQEAIEELTELSATAEVRVYCENPAEEKRFRELLAQQKSPLARKVLTEEGHLHTGFFWPAEKLVAVGHHEVFHRYAKVRRIRRVRAGRPIESLLDLQEGDYVVHVAHGIAKFEGLRTLQQDGRSEEFLRLRFADNAALHVPVSQINLVQKYIGSRGKRPSLSKLGGTSWSKQKARVTEAVKDLAAGMLRLQALREAMPGVSYPKQTEWQRQFVEEFVYTETQDQIASMEQIDDDMARTRPMDRLLCGDVGYGKTELAMRAAFKAAEAGKQVAVLVPTTVLAAQHFRTFCERFADYPFRIEMLSRFRSPKQIKDVVERLSAGGVDIVIGTHRLLSADVKFPDLGLAVVDEEQRFGVRHKEHLKSLRATVDVLTMTATPIPRTMHMALLGLRDISALATPPMDRRSIHTEVCQYDDRLVRQAILRELNRQGQVFFVHNRVMDIELLAEHIQKLVPETRIAVGHGQMPEGQLEKTMLRFVNQQVDVLVCTTIIESGLDIPSANTMIIHNADRFGLAELHQLRGRVGRSKHRAYCYLLLPEGRSVNSTAAKRLKAIEDFSDLGAGFQIAMRDLEIRGAGNILGQEQSGHIATVGYELYCQLLEHAVKQLRGESIPVRRSVHVELGVSALIPNTYIPSQRQRMEVYRRLAKCVAPQEIRQLAADVADAFGPVPEDVQTLLDMAEVRVRAGELGIESIIRMEPDIVFCVRDFSKVNPMFKNAVGSARLADSRTVHWRLPPAYREMPTLVRVLLKRLRDAQSAV